MAGGIHRSGLDFPTQDGGLNDAVFQADQRGLAVRRGHPVCPGIGRVCVAGASLAGARMIPWREQPVPRLGYPGSATANLLCAWDALDSGMSITTVIAWFERYYHSLIPEGWDPL